MTGADDSDDDEVSSGPMANSKESAMVRQRDKSPALQISTPTYGNNPASIVSTFRAWKVFRDSLGNDMMNQYQGTFGYGEVGLNAALAANQEVQGKTTKNELHTIPSYELIKLYLPKIKGKLGADSLSYLAALFETKLLSLLNNLGGILIKTDDG